MYCKGRSRNADSNQSIRRATVTMMESAFDIVPTYVPSAENRADEPSRGRSLHEHRRLVRRFDIPPELQTWMEEA
jgi:hypothetical protein